MIRYFIFINLTLCIFLSFNLNFSKAETGNQEKLKIFTGKWKDKCFENSENSKKYCLLERGMFLDKKSEKRVITMIFRTSESTSDVLLTIISPLGTLIPKGFNVSLDNKPLNDKDKPYGFSHCTQNGCFTNIRIKKEKIQSFKKTKALNLVYTLPNQQPLDINLNLNGFAEAFTKITKF